MENRMALRRIARPRLRSRHRLDVLLLVTLMLLLLVLFGFSESTCQARAIGVIDGHASSRCQGRSTAPNGQSVATKRRSLDAINVDPKR